jgi:hypothetical protein
VERIDPIESRTVECPCCGERVEIFLEADLEGEMVIDCEVCCRPWRVLVVRRRGVVEISVQSLEA